MIAVLLAFQLSAVTYENVPQELVRISVHDRTDDASPRPAVAEVDQQRRHVFPAAQAVRRRVVLLERADGAYLLDGPFVAGLDAHRVLDGRWRRTLASRLLSRSRRRV